MPWPEGLESGVPRAWEQTPQQRELSRRPGPAGEARRQRWGARGEGAGAPQEHLSLLPLFCERWFLRLRIIVRVTEATKVIKGNISVCKENGKLVFSKIRDEEWKCIFLEGKKKVFLARQLVVLNGKENEQQRNTGMEKSVAGLRRRKLAFCRVRIG